MLLVLVVLFCARVRVQSTTELDLIIASYLYNNAKLSPNRILVATVQAFAANSARTDRAKSSFQ